MDQRLTRLAVELGRTGVAGRAPIPMGSWVPAQATRSVLRRGQRGLPRVPAFQPVQHDAAHAELVQQPHGAVHGAEQAGLGPGSMLTPLTAPWSNAAWNWDWVKVSMGVGGGLKAVV